MLRIAVCLVLALVMAGSSVRPAEATPSARQTAVGAAALARTCAITDSVSVIGIAASHAGFLRDLHPLMNRYLLFPGVEVAGQGNTKDGVDYLRVWLRCPASGQAATVFAAMKADAHFRSVARYRGNCFVLARRVVDCG